MGRKPRRLGVFALFGGVSLTAIFVVGWVSMLTVGALYSEFGWLRPIGFWPALGISAGIVILAQALRGGGFRYSYREGRDGH